MDSPGNWTVSNITSQSENQRSILLPEIEHLIDSPIDWQQVDKINKPSLLNSVAHFFHNYIDPDIVVRIGKHLFNCHRLVLRTYSTYFEHKIQGQTVILPEGKVSPDTFIIIYDWMLDLTEQEPDCLTRRNVLDILMATQYLGIPQLEEQCWAFMDSPAVFTEETALLLYIEAVARNFKTVAEIMLPRISKAFLPLVRSGKFSELEKEVVCNLLSSNFIALHGEEEVLAAAVMWLAHDRDQRQGYIAEVMKCVRFGLLPPWRLSQIRGDRSKLDVGNVIGRPEVQDMIDEGMAYAVCRYSYNETTGEWASQLGLQVPQMRLWLDNNDQVTITPPESHPPQHSENQDRGAAGDRDSVGTLVAGW